MITFRVRVRNAFFRFAGHLVPGIVLGYNGGSDIPRGGTGVGPWTNRRKQGCKAPRA